MKEIERTIDRNAEWRKSIELMQSLFPKWQTSNEQLASWKDKFGMLNPEWFREALHLTYHTYNSDSPKPKWVAVMFKQIRAGHCGIPLNESTSESERHALMQQKTIEQEAIAVFDRNNARNEIKKWSQEERVLWAKKFKKRYAFLSGRNVVEDLSTWTTTFMQQVVVFKNMQSE